jgi:hypothetical protein
MRISDGDWSCCTDKLLKIDAIIICRLNMDIHFSCFNTGQEGAPLAVRQA